MPGTGDNHTRKAEEQEAERKRLAEQKSADQEGSVKEPENGASEVQAGKIIGNG